MNPDIVKLTEIFLVPTSILVGSLGIARTEPLKTGISIIGFVMSLLWLIGAWSSKPNTPKTADWLLLFLPVLFLICWLITTLVHAYLWRNESNGAGSKGETPL